VCRPPGETVRLESLARRRGYREKRCVGQDSNLGTPGGTDLRACRHWQCLATHASVRTAKGAMRVGPRVGRVCRGSFALRARSPRTDSTLRDERRKRWAIREKIRNGPVVEGCLCIGIGGGLYTAFASPSLELNWNVRFFRGPVPSSVATLMTSSSARSRTKAHAAKYALLHSPGSSCGGAPARRRRRTPRSRASPSSSGAWTPGGSRDASASWRQGRPRIQGSMETPTTRPPGQGSGAERARPRGSRRA